MATTGFPPHDEGRADPNEPVAAGEDVQRVPCRLEAGVRDGVVEPDARPFRHNPAPENVAYGLCGTDHVPLAIGHNKMRGVFPVMGNEGGSRAGRRCRLGTYLCSFFGPVFL